MKLNDIWCEKYRPKTIDDIVLGPSAEAQLRSISQNKSIPHLLLHGPAGIGKTSAAKIIVNDILKCQYIYINASDESGIDTVRTKITGFAKTKSIDGGIKVIILDECLDEETEVHILRDGDCITMPIKDLNSETDLVKSYNFEKDCIEYRPFNHFYMGEQDDCYEIEFENGETIICTGSHKWYVEGDDGRPVKMKLNDIIKNKKDIIFTKLDD